MIGAVVLSAWSPAQAVRVAPERLVFGEIFELTVTAAEPFDIARLRPLQVELVSRTPRGELNELRFRARCYQLGAVTLPLDPPHTLQIASCLPDAASALEWPADGWLLERSSSWPWLMFGLLLLLGSAGIWWRRRSQAAEQVPTREPREPAWDALAALGELGDGEQPGDAFFLQLKAIVRRHCAERFHLPAAVRTSEELLQALPRVRPLLQPCLTTCDVVLFGGAVGEDRRLDPAARSGARDQAVRFVETTRAGPSVAEARP